MRTAVAIGLAAAGAAMFVGLLWSLRKALNEIAEFEFGDDDWSQEWADECQQYYDDDDQWDPQLLDIAVSRDGRIMMSLELVNTDAIDEAAE